jgi:FkbM family methyltransferase
LAVQDAPVLIEAPIMQTTLKREKKGAAVRLAERIGYTVLPTWRLHNRELAAHLRKLFKQFDVDCVIDVGANDGGYARFLRLEVGYTGLLLSFEPVSALAATCRTAAANDPNWHIFDCAIGNENTETEINVAAYSKFSSLLPAAESLPDAMSALMATSHKEVVKVRRLDHVLPELRRTHGYKRPYLKVDTQGFDLAVLEGAGDLMQTMVAAQTELSFRPIYKGMPSWRTVMDVLEAHRFSVSNMFAISMDAGLRAIEFDCVVVNDRFVTKV